MANYFVINNKFRPYSFDELIKPYQIYGEEYKRQESILNELEAKASDLEAALSQTNDPESYAKYSAYLEGVKQTADQIATSGINTNTRRRANQLAGSFHKDIIPIQAAANRRRELADEQRKALSANPTLIYQRNFNSPGEESSIDKFVEDPNYNWGGVYSGALLEKQVSDVAKNLSKVLSNYGKGKPLDAYTNTFIEKYGFSPEEVQEAVNNPDSPSAPAVLNAIVDSVMDSSGMKDWASNEQLQQGYWHARRGLFSAIGEDKVTKYENYRARLAAQRAAAQATSPSSYNGVKISPINFYTKKERKQVRDNMNKYSKYFTARPDGTYVLNEEGRKAYADKPNNYGPGWSEFKKFLNSNKADLNSAGKFWTDYINSTKTDQYDMTKRTEYRYHYDPSEQNNLKVTLASVAGGLPLQEVDFDTSTNKWVSTGKTIPSSKIMDSKTVIGDVFMSYGDAQIELNIDGDLVRVKLPGGFNSADEASRNSAISRAEEVRWRINQETPRSAQEEAQMREDYSRYLQEAYLYQSQWGLSNKTEDQKFSPYVTGIDE